MSQVRFRLAPVHPPHVLLAAGKTAGALEFPEEGEEQGMHRSRPEAAPVEGSTRTRSKGGDQEVARGARPTGHRDKASKGASLPHRVSNVGYFGRIRRKPLIEQEGRIPE